MDDLESRNAGLPPTIEAPQRHPRRLPLRRYGLPTMLSTLCNYFHECAQRPITGWKFVARTNE